MYLLDIQPVLANSINEGAFLLALFISSLFYSEYRKCLREIQDEELLDGLLKD